MRTKNSDWVISQTLNALFSQKGVEFELYIVDSGSTDNTLAICDDFPHQKLPMASETYVPGPVLNDAIQMIEQSIIIMLNSDSVLLHPNSLKKLVDPLKESTEIVATVGRQLPRPDAQPWVRKDYLNAFPNTDSLPENITLSFPLSAFKKSVWVKEKFYEKSWGSEDTEWGKRILDKNLGKIKYIPEATTMHSHNYNNIELHNRKFIEGEADYFIYKVEPNAMKALYGYARRCISELKFYLLNNFFLSTPKIFQRNIYYFLGYYRGLRSAKNRDLKNIDKLAHKPY